MDKLHKKKLDKIYKKIDKLALRGKLNTTEYYKYIDELILNGDYGSLEQTLYHYYDIDIINFDSVNDVKKKTWSEILSKTSSSFLKKLSDLYKKRKVYQSSFDIYSYDTSLLNIDLSEPLLSDYTPSGTSSSISFQVSNEKISLNILNKEVYNVQIFKSKWVSGEPTDVELLQNINIGESIIYETQIPTTYISEYLITTYQRDLSGSPQNYVLYNYKFGMSREALLGQIREIDTYTEDAKYLLQNKEFAKLKGEFRYLLEVTKDGEVSYISGDDPSLSFDQNLLNRYSIALDILKTI